MASSDDFSKYTVLPRMIWKMKTFCYKYTLYSASYNNMKTNTMLPHSSFLSLFLSFFLFFLSSLLPFFFSFIFAFFLFFLLISLSLTSFRFSVLSPLSSSSFLFFPFFHFCYLSFHFILSFLSSFFYSPFLPSFLPSLFSLMFFLFSNNQNVFEKSSTLTIYFGGHCIF